MWHTSGRKHQEPGRGSPEPRNIKDSDTQGFAHQRCYRRGSLCARATLSGGEQQMLAISRVLLGQPRLIMFDEPSEGVMPSMVALVRDTISRVCETGASIILVEQNVRMALSIARRVYIQQKGLVTYAGSTQDCPEEVLLQHMGV